MNEQSSFACIQSLQATQERIDEILNRKYPHDLSYSVFPTLQGVLTLESIMLGKGLPFPAARQYLINVKHGQ
jgi:hypothetical protein